MDINCLLFPAKNTSNIANIKKHAHDHLYYDNYLAAAGFVEEAPAELTTRSNNSEGETLPSGPRMLKSSESASPLSRRQTQAANSFRKNMCIQEIQSAARTARGCSSGPCSSAVPDLTKVRDYIPCLYLEGSRKVIVYFHGNAQDLSTTMEFVNFIHRYSGYSILAMQFQGYSVYDGVASAENIEKDSSTVVEYLLKIGLAPNQITVMGRSIGSGPAIYLTTRFKLAALVLVSPFTSICDLIRDKYGVFPSMLVRQRFLNRQRIAQNTSPTLIIHGMLDNIIPESHAVKLQQNCKGFCKLKLVQNMTHSEFDFEEDLLVPLLDFFRSINF